jgi:hypothetical protein
LAAAEEVRGRGVQSRKFRSSEVRSSGLQEFRSSEVQKFRSSGLLEFGGLDGSCICGQKSADLIGRLFKLVDVTVTKILAENEVVA